MAKQPCRITMTPVTIARDSGAPDTVAVEMSAPAQLRVAGALTFRTATRAAAEGERCLSAATAQELHVDCSAVHDADSAGLAVLIDWVAWARRDGRKLHFAHLPPAIVAVASISEVDHLLV